MRLTANMRKVLTKAKHAPIRRPHPPGPGAPPWPEAHRTLYALVHHELVTRSEIRDRDGQPLTLWTITTAGRAALEPPELVKTDRPTYLSDRRKATPDWRDPHDPEHEQPEDYTSDPARRIDHIEITDPDRLKLVWDRQAKARVAALEDRRDRARRLARSARRAA